MVVQDIVHSCSNEKVAAAALASIGGVFARQVHEAANRRGVLPGALAAAAVVRFRSEARAHDFERLQRAIAGDDTPVLRGFRLIVEPALAGALCPGAGYAGRGAGSPDTARMLA